jgi:hypothetical protein
MGTAVRWTTMVALAGLALLVLLGTGGCAGGGTDEPPVSTKGTVSGTVTGPGGTVLSGATVQLNSTVVASVKTGADGTYAFHNVPSGSYKALGTYSSSTAGLLTGTSATITIDAVHKTVTANLTLKSNGPPPPPF